MATQQPILFSLANPSHASNAEYIHINTRNNNWNGTLASNELLIPTAGKFVKLNIKIDVAPGSGNSRTFTLMVDGIASAITILFENTDTELSVTTDVAFSGGETVTLKNDPTSTPDQFTRIDGNFIWEPTVDDEYIYMTGHPGNALHTSNTEYQPVEAGAKTWGATTSKILQPFPTAGVLKKLAVKVDATPGTGGETYTFKIMKGGTASTETVVISDGDEGTTQFNTNDFQTMAAGDEGSIQVVPAGGPTPINALISCVFVPTTTGKIPLLGGSGNDAMNATTTEYMSIGEDNTLLGVAERADRETELVGIELVFEAAYVKLNSTAGGAGYDINFQVDQVNQAAMQIVLGSGDSDGNVTGASVTVSAGETINLEVVPDSTPSTRTCQHGYLYTFGAAAAPTFTPRMVAY